MAKKQEHEQLSVPAGVTPHSISYVNGPGYYSFYTNNAAFALNQLDFVLILGEIVDMKMPQQEAVVERRARVTMTPMQGKALAKILTSMVASYEAQNGPIKDLQLLLPGGQEV